MKIKIVQIIKSIIAFISLLGFGLEGFSQSGINVIMKNVANPNPKKVTFEIWLENASSGSNASDVLSLQSLQLSFGFNAAVAGTGTITPSLELGNPNWSVVGQQSPTITSTNIFNVASIGTGLNFFRLAAATASAPSTVIPTTANGGIRYATFAFTNSVDFVKNLPFNFTFNTTLSTNGRVKTQVNAYLGSLTLGAGWNNPANTTSASGYPSSRLLNVIAPQYTIVSSDPTISQVVNLSEFTTCSGSVSSAQNFTVSGTDLTDNITVTAPTGYEVSTTSGSGFASTATLTQVSGTVATTTVYARLSSAATGTPSGNITLTSTGATTQNVAVSGTANTLPVLTITPSTQTVCNNANTSTEIFTSTVSGTTYTWSNDNNTIGIGASGSGSAIASFTATNTGISPIIGTFTVTPVANSCLGATQNFTITVNPIPAAPSLTSTPICGSGTVTFTTAASRLNTPVSPNKLYNAASAGSVVGTGFTTPTISQTTDFWATQTVGSCESARTKVTATVKQASASSMSKSVCGSYMFGTKTLTASGVYKDTIPNMAGCDSVRTLNLTIKQATASSTIETACGSFVFGNRTLTTSGIYKDTIPNMAGCDSVRTLNLTINTIPAVLGLHADPICNSGTVTFYDNASGRLAGSAAPFKLYNASVNGNVVGNGLTSPSISQTTDFWATITTNGCESPRTKVTGIVNQPSVSSINKTSCDSYSFGGMNLTESGTYKDTIPNLAGCDSVITLNLTIKTKPLAPNVMEPNAVCDSSSYLLSAVIGSIGRIQCRECGDDNIYLWKNEASDSVYNDADFQTPMLYKSTYYTVTAANECGVSGPSSVNIQINKIELPTLTSSPICKGNTAEITASYNAPTRLAAARKSGLSIEYVWYNSNMDSLASTDVYTTENLDENADYFVKVKMFGCESTKAKTTAIVNHVDTAVSVQNRTITANAENQIYQWVDMNSKTIIDGATENSYTPSVTGTYAVVITQSFVNNSCTDTSAARYVEVIITGLENTNTSFSVYPNPSSDIVHVTLTESISGTVSIVNANGIEMISKAISGNTFNVSTSDLVSGVYILKVNAQNTSLTKQIVIVR